MTFDVYYLNGELVTFEDAYKFCKENKWAFGVKHIIMFTNFTMACGNAMALS